MPASLLFFRADGCGVCHLKAPLVEEIAREMGLSLETVDLGAPGGAERADRLRIRIVPTLALVDGPRVRFRLVGRMITRENVAHLATLSAAPAGSADPPDTGPPRSA
jgi:thiol-disulfide isomerase/thioredoxin